MRVVRPVLMLIIKKLVLNVLREEFLMRMVNVLLLPEMLN
jgi:hypothetical protein